MQLTGCRSSPASEVPRGAGLVVIDGLPQAALLESGKPLGFLVQRPLNDIHRSPRLGDRATLVGLTSPEGSWSLDDRNRCTIDPLRSPLSNVWYMLIAVIDLTKVARRPIAVSHDFRPNDRFGISQAILDPRERIEHQTIETRRTGPTRSLPPDDQPRWTRCSLRSRCPV